jgi:hypothetical protein
VFTDGWTDAQSRRFLLSPRLNGRSTAHSAAPLLPIFEWAEAFCTQRLFEGARRSLVLPGRLPSDPLAHACVIAQHILSRLDHSGSRNLTFAL